MLIRRGLGAALLIASAWIVGADTAAAADATVTQCTDAALRSAVAGGGVVDFAVDCADLQLTGPLVIGAGATVDIRAGGHTVVLDGRAATRPFVVDGGTLAISGDIRLTSGAVKGAAGTAGAVGVDGGPGGAGTPGKEGTQGA